MTDQISQLDTLLMLRQQNRVLWKVHIGLALAILTVGVVQLILMVKIVDLLKQIYLSIPS